ncbi:MAG: helicase HerA-like domain-containing protein [Gemmataceae bacterium]
MINPIHVATSGHEIDLLPKMSNRHGLIAGATGTGKTVTLQRLAEGFSRIGVPVFMADVKGDLSGICKAASPPKPAILNRVKELGLEKQYRPMACPVVFWDVFGEQGHPVRATISEMGPMLLSRLMGLNEVQAGVLSITFRVADDNGLLLLDLKDLRAMLQFVSQNSKDLSVTYGNVSAASVGAIQRGLLRLEEQGGNLFFGEPALNLDDLIQTDERGLGVVNILVADKLIHSPQLYATFLLWLLAQLFEQLPEVGDPEKPKLVFFFDEAHLLFDDAPKPLLTKIEQVVRLIRSKGVGVYFVTQNPRDVPDEVLGQLGNRVQHALRAFTPRDQKAVRAAAETFRSNPKLDVSKAITELQVGEALVSLLDIKGTPGIVERALIVPPSGQIGPITLEERKALLKASIIAGQYEKMIDRESAYEILTRKTAATSPTPPAGGTGGRREPPLDYERQREKDIFDEIDNLEKFDKQKKKIEAPRRSDSVFDAFAKSAARSVATGLGRVLNRGILDILGGKPRRR